MSATANPTVRVPLGRVVITPAARDALSAGGVDAPALLARHARGDWGAVDADDRAANDAALRDGERVLSAYPIPSAGDDDRLWIITEADRSVTTLLVPSDY